MLCLHCLAKRIGRPLTSDDFPNLSINRRHNDAIAQALSLRARRFRQRILTKG
jgi:hypothetical protein